MTTRPAIWRSPTMRARLARERRQRDVAGMRALADRYDAKRAKEAAEAEPDGSDG